VRERGEWISAHEKGWSDETGDDANIANPPHTCCIYLVQSEGKCTWASMMKMSEGLAPGRETECGRSVVLGIRRAHSNPPLCSADGISRPCARMTSRREATESAVVVGVTQAGSNRVVVYHLGKQACQVIMIHTNEAGLYSNNCCRKQGSTAAPVRT
jgi:hypothetical protein